MLCDRLEADPDRLSSAVSLRETIAGLVRSDRFTVEAARLRVEEFCVVGAIRLVPIGEAEFTLAVEA